MSDRRLLGRIDPDAVVATASDLIAVEGHQDHPREERDTSERFATMVEEVVTSGSAVVTLEEVAGDRRNVVLRLSGDHPGPTLLLNGHLDTVPGYGMTDAYTPRMDEGRLYGRGAVDMKGALAAMLQVAAVLSGPDVSFGGELILAAVVGEENGSPGMQALAASGISADFAVVGEPTELRVARAHKGSMWIEAEFTGRATHGSAPEHGVNAIYHAARFITAVEADLVPRLSQRTHPLLGPATTTVGVVRGGDRPPMVPARCRVQLDRRWLPGEAHAEVIAEYERLIEKLAGEDPTVSAEVREMEATAGFPHTPLECPPEVPALHTLCRIVNERLGAPSEPVGVTFWTDGALLAAETGTPTVVCGPGSIAQAHSLDEWIDVGQLQAAADVYGALAIELLDASIPGDVSTEPPTERER